MVLFPLCIKSTNPRTKVSNSELRSTVLLYYQSVMENIKVQSKIALITAASMGLRKAIAFCLAEAGATVIINFISSKSEGRAAAKADLIDLMHSYAAMLVKHLGLIANAIASGLIEMNMLKSKQIIKPSLIPISLLGQPMRLQIWCCIWPQTTTSQVKPLV
jgi:NAD(P)-dependent dehydrogenase (short-subunit alcohol dehydrogenase family)